MVLDLLLILLVLDFVFHLIYYEIDFSTIPMKAVC